MTVEQLRRAVANSSNGDEFDELMGWHRTHGAGRPDDAEQAS
ncbi:hypothetical protein ACFOYW_13375 [Gryllotalpicola reticulitermitis]|uniref:Uncharacterized protein n=1 Tax=Gryllotalpicola reticulitermitis TaxID=1184153 RepID=A0ABV8Q7P7_9MICO